MNLNAEPFRQVLDVHCRYTICIPPELKVIPRHDEYVRQLPSSSAVYCLLTKTGEITYIGQSTRLRRRICQHAASGKFSWDEFSVLAYVEVPNEDRSALLELETVLIVTAKPPRNTALMLRLSRRRLAEIRFRNSRRS